MGESENKMDSFGTGATRSNDDDKLDFDGFFSPLVLKRCAEYNHKHRTQADGKMRASDNWQLGIPIPRYRKSLWRHFFDAWTLLRGWPVSVGEYVHKDGSNMANGEATEDALCAVIFNASGLLHELLKKNIKSTGEVR